jgi:hypothetical protein
MNSGEVSTNFWRADNFSANGNAATPDVAGRRWHVATLRYLIDPEREVLVPVGVVLFAEGVSLWGVRTLRKEEFLSGVASESLPGIALMRDLLVGWLASGELPYATDAVTPYSLAWWRHLAGLLGHRVRLETIRPTLCETPASDLETLYQVIVRPMDRQTDKVGTGGAAYERLLKESALANP